LIGKSGTCGGGHRVSSQTTRAAYCPPETPGRADGSDYEVKIVRSPELCRTWSASNAGGPGASYIRPASR
jgi:hypothetical protein